MKNPKLRCEFCPAGYSRFIMFNGGETGSESPDLPKNPEKAEPMETGDMNPEAAASEAKGKGAKMVSAAEEGAVKLQEGAEKQEAPKSDIDFVPGQVSDAAKQVTEYVTSTKKYKDFDAKEMRSAMKGAIENLWAQHKAKYEDAKIAAPSVRGKYQGDTVSDSEPMEIDYGVKPPIRLRMTSSIKDGTHKLNVAV